jgi:hypothetical protein
MYCIVEVQGYSTKELSFLPKEVFLCADEMTHKYFIKPPKALNDFTKNDQKVIEWNSFRYHHLPWPAGNIELGSFLLDIKARTSNYKFILCKGGEKAAYLTKILNRSVIDLTYYNFPSIRNIPGSPCNLHFSRNSKCAVVTAKFLKDYIDGQPHIKSLFNQNK